MSTSALTSLPVADTWNMHGAGAGWMVVMMVGMALFWGALILGFVWLVRDGVESWQHRTGETAASILDRRFAEGALSLDEYHQRRDVLVGTAVPRSDQGVGSRDSERRQR